MKALSILVAAALAAGVALLEALAGNTGKVTAIAVLAVVVPVAYGLFRWLKPLARKFELKDIFSPLVAFPLLYTAWFIVGSIDLVQVPRSVAYGLFEPVPWYVLGYAALGLGAYGLGVMLQKRRVEPKREIRTVEFPWTDSWFWAVVVGLGATMVVFYGIIVAGIGMIPALDPAAGEVRLEIRSYGPAQAVLFTCAWTLIPLLMMYVWKRRPAWHVRFLCYGGVAVTTVMLLSLGGRTNAFLPVLTTLIARHYVKKRFSAGRLALVGAVLFSMISLIGYTRDMSLTGANFGDDRLGIPGQIVPFIYSYLYVRYPVATFRDVTEMIPRKVPYQYGAMSLGPLTTLLPGHHEQSDMFFKDMLGNDFVGAGQPATLLGPLYADAGLFGIVAAMFLTGMLTARAHAWMLAEPTVLRVLLYAWLMQTLLFSLFLDLFPFITTIWIPTFWVGLHALTRTARGENRTLAPTY